MVIRLWGILVALTLVVMSVRALASAAHPMASVGPYVLLALAVIILLICVAVDGVRRLNQQRFDALLTQHEEARRLNTRLRRVSLLGVGLNVASASLVVAGGASVEEALGVWVFALAYALMVGGWGVGQYVRREQDAAVRRLSR